jgi:hypothetical protein
MTTATASKKTPAPPVDPQEKLRLARKERDETVQALHEARGAIRTASKNMKSCEVRDQWAEAEILRRETMPTIARRIDSLEVELKGKETALSSAEAEVRDAGLRKYRLLVLEMVRSAAAYKAALEAVRAFWETGGAGLGGSFATNEAVHAFKGHAEDLATWLPFARGRCERLFGAGDPS